MKKIYVSLLALVACFALLGGCGQVASRFQSWDENGNSTLSSEEISRGLLELADSDQNGALDRMELQQGLVDINLLEEWDQNEDGRITATDFTFIFVSAAGDSQTRFSDWDTDGDGTLSETEFADSFFQRYDQDRDDLLSRGELERIVVLSGGIADYDVDEDGELSFGELRAAALRI